MATFVNDLRLTELATGEGSGTWGTTTNTNLELVAEAFSFGTEAITTNADTHTTTIADGSTDPGRSIFLKYTGTLDSACTITIGPNTVSKLWLIENATSGSQTIIIKQGSGATITIPNGQTKAIYSDGAGSGGAMVAAFQDLSIPDLFIDDDLTIGDDLTFTSDSAVITFGADGDTTLTHTDGSGLTLNSTNKIMFNDASQFIQGSSATVLSLGATDEIDLTATLIDINGNADVSGTVTATGTSVFASLDISGDIDVDGTTNLDVVDIDGAVDMASTLQVDGAITSDAGAIISVTDNSDVLTLRSTDADANIGPVLTLNRNSATPADDDLIGSIEFDGRNDATQAVEYAQIIAQIRDATDGTEDGALYLQTIVAGTKRERVTLLEAETVVNNAGVDLDFRVESDGNANMLFVDGANNRVAVGHNAPSEVLHVVAANPVLTISSSSVDQLARLELFEQKNGSTDLGGFFEYSGASANTLLIGTTLNSTDTAHLTLPRDGTGNVGIGQSSPDTLLHLAGEDTAVIRLENSDTSLGANQIIGGVEFEKTDGSGAGAGVVGGMRMKSDGSVGEATYLALSTSSSSANDQERLRINGLGSVGIGVADGDVTSDGTAARTYVGIIGTANRGRLNLGTTASNGADAGTLAFTNGTNSLAELVVDTHSGVQNAGDFTLDVTGDIVFDADGGDFNFKDGGTTLLTLSNAGSNNVQLSTSISDGDLLIKGNDGGSIITALTLDMSAAGAASFNSSVSGTSLIATEGLLELDDNGTHNGVINVPASCRINIDSDNNSTGESFQVGVNATNISSGNILFKIDESGNTTVGDPTYGNSLGQLRVINDAANTAPASLSLFGFGNRADDEEFAKIEFAMQTSGTGGNVVAKINGVAEGTGENAADLVFQTATSGTLAERMRITSSGSLLVNQTTAGAMVHVTNNNQPATTLIALVDEGGTGAHTQISFANTNGQVGTINTSGSATAYNTSSDYRLKENITDLTSATDRLKQLAPKRFNFINDADTTVDGFIAHEVSSIVPEAITGEKDAVDDDGNPVYQGIDQSKLVPLLVATIKELEARIAALESQ